MSVLPNQTYASIGVPLFIPITTPIPQGPTGPQGPQGTEGPVGATGSPGNASSWATFPAISNVDMSLNNVTRASRIQVANGTTVAPSYSFTNDLTSGIILPASGNISIVTAGNAGVRVGSTGNMSVNTPLSSYNVDVNGQSRFQGVSFVTGVGASSNVGMRQTVDASNSYIQYGSDITAGGTGTGNLFFSGIFGSPSVMTLGSNGNIGIGTTPVSASPGGVTLAFPNDGAGLIWGNGASRIIDIGNLFIATDDTIFFNRGASAGSLGTTTMILDGNGNVGIGLGPSYQLQLSTDSAAKPSTSTWTVVSDRRMKTNIEDANTQICYDVIKNLKLRRYQYDVSFAEAREIKDKTMLGWIAQEVEPIFPKAVSRVDVSGGTDMYGLDVDQIYKSMFGALQKVIEDKERLEYEVQQLKAQLG